MGNTSLLRGYGLLPNKAVSLGIQEPSGSISKEKTRIIAEARRLANEKTKPMREKMEEMERRHKEMVEEIDRMRSTMMAMRQSVSAKDNTGPVLVGSGRRTGVV
jgi:predicted phosphoribosyltransferase